MSELALARIYNFASVAQQTDVQPPEEPIFVLAESQLQDIISRAIQEAMEPLYQEMLNDPKGSQSLSRESHNHSKETEVKF